jgi:hypothetical protein
MFLYVGIFSVFLCDSGICDSKKIKNWFINLLIIYFEH